MKLAKHQTPYHTLKVYVSGRVSSISAVVTPLTLNAKMTWDRSVLLWNRCCTRL